MAEKSMAVKKALAIMARNKKMRDAGVPPGQEGAPAYYGKDASQDGYAPRALTEEMNNQMAQEMFKKMSPEQKKKFLGE